MKIEGEEVGGYAGKLLRVNLSNNSIKEEALSLKDLEFLGGAGLATRYICERVSPQTDPLGPENLLVFMTGPLTGTFVPTSSRFTVAARSPLTGGWGEAHAAGFFGVELKKAGYDGILIEGRASSPVYLLIRDSEVEIRGAERYWGKDVYTTDEELKKELGEGFNIAAIGPAGERMIKIASIASSISPGGPRICGRSGMGAVMGSKNLKAVAVKGSGKVEVKEPGKLREYLRRIMLYIMSQPTVQRLGMWGTPGEMDVAHEVYGDVPIKNWTLGLHECVEKLFQAVSSRRYIKEDKGCVACPIRCWKVMEMEGRLVRAPEYETVASLGTMLLIDDYEKVAKLNLLCNKYGIDTISAGTVIAWAMECFERGILTKEEVGLDLRWGDAEAALRMLELICKREGIGELLAEGVKKASEKVGRGSEKFAMHVKGLELPMHDPRAFSGMGLVYATSNRGACHLAGWPVYRLEQGERIVDLEIYERGERFGTKGKGRYVAIIEDYMILIESLPLCKFFPITPGQVASVYSLATGRTRTLKQLMEASTRIFNLQRLFNLACGVKEDALPPRLLTEPTREGGCRGQTVDLEPMLREYYSFRGWDERGVPSLQTIEKYQLSEFRNLFSAG
ncbi:MAG: aldehyde ferredoxin oxidoreductase family protein [Candidatus Hadarchaeales archaeon]